MGALSDVLIVAGAALAMIGGIGAVRFRDLYSRMHAAAKAPTLGLVLVAIGAAIAIDTLLAYTTLLLVVILQLLSSPVGAHALSRASRRQTRVALDGPDHLTRDEAAATGRDHSAMSEPPEERHLAHRRSGFRAEWECQTSTMRIDWISIGSVGTPSGEPAAAIAATVVSKPSVTWPNNAYSGGSAAPSVPVMMKNWLPALSGSTVLAMATEPIWYSPGAGGSSTIV